jgi:azurin
MNSRLPRLSTIGAAALLSLAAAGSTIVSAQTPAPAAKPATAPAPAAQGTAKPADKAGAAARTVEIIGTDDMKYNVTTINAKPGEQLRIKLTSKGVMPKIAMAHNVVVLKKEADPAAFATAAASARATDFIPAANKADVIANTGLAGPGETVEVVFKVPAAAGSYPFLCTFPGHFVVGMKGNLVVK